jgi:hypothetical protein
MGMGVAGHEPLLFGQESTTPQVIETNVVAAAAGNDWSMFISADGSLYTMGNNDSGQLGNGNKVDSESKVLIDTGVRAISGSGYHGLYIKTDGTLMGMGSNNGGELGDGTKVNRTSPVFIDTDVLAIDATFRSLYIKAQTYPVWLNKHFTTDEQQNTDITSETSDPDGDGHSNYFEYLAKLDPQNSESRLRYQYTNDSGETLRIWPMTDSSDFEIQTSTDMSAWSSLDSSLYQLSGDFLDIDLAPLSPSIK